MTGPHRILPAVLLALMGLSGCTSAAGPKEHPKLDAMERLVREMGTRGADEPVAGKAIYLVSIAPEGIPFRQTSTGSGQGFEYEIYSSHRTIDDATAATIFEAYTTPGGQLRTGLAVYLWRGGAWVDELDALIERSRLSGPTSRPPAIGPAGPPEDANIPGAELSSPLSRPATRE